MSPQLSAPSSPGWQLIVEFTSSSQPVPPLVVTREGDKGRRPKPKNYNRLEFLKFVLSCMIMMKGRVEGREGNVGALLTPRLEDYLPLFGPKAGVANVD